ncbi:hypothetical protein [Nocardia sp. alder85J]|uniref:hypothetical protein n=1 Tax=Nocardia sp. alder85J TaxID=2862949 RepID=UPI001CD62466|nr:hypothetical protein [Nocardia sp. alder85J]MCX4094768.1 hypothetical protein [Nocardia sp. alder85J]
MGYFDTNCLVTGVSLRPVDATLVVLQRVPGAYRPITLGMTGTHDRYGAIDGIEEDLNTDLVVGYFRARQRDGRFAAPEWDCDETEVDVLVAGIARTCGAVAFPDFPAGFPIATALDGEMIVHALIARPVWDALTQVAIRANDTVENQFERIFGPDSPATEIYRDRLTDLEKPIRELAAVTDFLSTHGLIWAPPPEPAQRYPTVGYGAIHTGDDVRDYLRRAQRDYQDIPGVRLALTRYAAAARELNDW